MVPARNLQQLAHGTPPFAAAAAAAGLGVTAAAPRSSHMAQEPLDHRQHRHEPSKHPTPHPPHPPPPPPQEGQADHHETRRHAEAAAELAEPDPDPARPPPLLLAHHPQEAAGTSGSSSGGSCGNGGAGDWLRLGLAPAPAESPSAGAQLGGAFGDRAGPPPTVTAADALPAMGVPPGPFFRQAVPGIRHASITLPAPRAGPPWLPPWSPSAAPPPPPTMLPFAHRSFYTPGAGAGASGLDAIRAVLPPPAAGVWFALQAAPHQGREPFLPQIARSYLRIKDGRVTVGLLIKYLASKLGLEDESEVEITCRGRPLRPALTLQHVRDGIWCQQQGDAAAAVSPSSVAPDLSAANHLMVLQYGRSRP